MKRTGLILCTVAIAAMGFAGSASAQCTPAPDPTANANMPIQYPVDFCATLDGLAALLQPGGTFEWLPDLLGSDAALLTGLTCAGSDINGPLVDGMPTANGMLDQYELGLLAEIINNPANYPSLPGGVTGQEVLDAFQTNYNFIYTQGAHDLLTGPTGLPGLWSVAQPLLCGEIPVTPCPLPATYTPELQNDFTTVFTSVGLLLAGAATVGDTDSINAVLAVVALISFCDLLSPGVCLITDTQTDGACYPGFEAVLSKNGNADTDADLNYNEYLCYGPLGGPDGLGTISYAEAALSDQYLAADCGLPSVGISGGGIFEEGTDITLTATVANATPVSYAWFKDLGPLAEVTDTLLIAAAVPADSGAYRVEAQVDDGTKAIVTVAGSMQVTVVASGSLPVAGGLGISLLAGACALAGAAVIRRKK